MSKHIVAIPARPTKNLEHYTIWEGKRRDDQGKWSIGDPDYMTEGRGKKESSIWHVLLGCR